MGNTINIVKHSGDVVAFDVNKLINSLRRSQASDELVRQIVEKVENQIYDGITTKQIYKMAFKILKGKSRVSASKYKLKKALMELGPSGFPFEKLVGKILEQEGFETRVGVIVQGNCVQHEVDVIARLMTFTNVLITSHQAFLTDTALTNIADTTLYNLDCFEKQIDSGNEVASK